MTSVLRYSFGGLCVIAGLSLTSCDTAPVEPNQKQATVEAASALSITYETKYLGELRPDQGYTFSSSINVWGQIVGRSGLNIFGVPSHAYLWQNGTMRDLGAPADWTSRAEDINDWGQVIGQTHDIHPNEGGYVVLWQGGTMIRIPGVSTAASINNLGQIVGVYSGTDGVQRGYIWQFGFKKDLGTYQGHPLSPTQVNDRGQVVGSFSLEDGLSSHAFLWQPGSVKDLGTLGGTYSIAYGINEKGQVVGMSTLANGEERAFLWEKGVMKDLGTLGGGYSEARAINNLGQVVGTSKIVNYIHGSGQRAFLWQNGVMTELMLPTEFPSDLNDSHAMDINIWGQVAGWSLERDHYNKAIIWTPKLVRSARAE